MEKVKVNYIEKDKFYQAMLDYAKKRDEAKQLIVDEYNKAVEDAKSKGEDIPDFEDEYWQKRVSDTKPVPSNYIGECIMKIANHLASRPNFFGYTYKEDFIADAIESCIKYIDNFDPHKSTNPFGYFTTVCWYRFVQTIREEKDQSVVKGSLMMQSLPEEFLTLDDEDDEFGINDDIRNNHRFVELAYEEKIKREELVQKRKEEKAKQKEEELQKKNLSFLLEE